MHTALKDHISALKSIIHKISATFAILFAFGLLFSRILAKSISTYIDFKSYNIHIMLSSPFQAISMYLNIAFMLAIALTIPYAVYLAFKFIEPALKEEEKKMINKIIPLSYILFITGILIGYFVLVKYSLIIISEMSYNTGLETYWSMNDVISLMFYLPLITGAVFQFPILLAGLMRLGLITQETISKNRKYAFVGILLISGIITPSNDIFTQLLMAMPVYVLYESTSLFCRIIFGKKENW